MKPQSLHTPAAERPLRVNIRLSGALAAEIAALAAEYQTDAATLVRELAVDGLRARRRLRESA